MEIPTKTPAASVIDVRRDLASVFRLAARLGLHEGTCNHFSALAPHPGNGYLINPFGIHFSEMRASDLLLLDEAGRVVEGRGEVEETAFFIHSQIHRANPQAVCVLHTHMPYATAITSLQGGRLAMCHQNAARFHGRIAYDDETTAGYQGLALADVEGARMVRALGPHAVLMLEGHGPLVTGADVAQAFDDLYYLERAAQVQILAASTGLALYEIEAGIAQQTAAEFRRQAPQYARAHLDALQRILDREDPSWRN